MRLKDSPQFKKDQIGGIINPKNRLKDIIYFYCVTLAIINCIGLTQLAIFVKLGQS